MHAEQTELHDTTAIDGELMLRLNHRAQFTPLAVQHDALQAGKD
jgi:hypothetical protein